MWMPPKQAFRSRFPRLVPGIFKGYTPLSDLSQPRNLNLILLDVTFTAPVFLSIRSPVPVIA